MPVRGKCRFCNHSVRRRLSGIWMSEWGGSPDPDDCGDAPLEVCPSCAGLGYHESEERDEDGEPKRSKCGYCEGLGEVPGPHWPWRHPPYGG